MEDLSKSRSDIRPIAFPDIPTPDEHAREVRRIFTVCGSFAATFLLAAVTGISIAVNSGVPLPVIAAVSVMSSFICIVSFGIGYACPVGLVSLRRLEIAYRMGYKGLTMNQEVTTSIKGMVKEVKPMVQKIETNLNSIAEKVRRDTAPLSIIERTTTES